MALTDKLTNIANAIREKTGSTDTMNLEGMAAAVTNIKIPTALSDLNEDETHRTVTDAEKKTWNNKSNFSGNYDDLKNKPTIPTIPEKLPNPNALTFTGAVEGSYDGSEPLTVEIPEGGSGEAWELIADITTTELVRSISITKDQAGQPFAFKKAILMTNTKQERVDEVSYTGLKRMTVQVNGTGILYGQALLSSANDFITARTDLEIKNGQLFGEAVLLAGEMTSPQLSPVCVLLEAETIGALEVLTDFQFVSGLGVVTRFSVGSQFKLYGVRA